MLQYHDATLATAEQEHGRQYQQGQQQKEHLQQKKHLQ